MSTKPADLGERCYLYDTFGKCMYGITCRFAGAHTGPGFTSLVKEDISDGLGQTETVKNSLDKELQRRLRKRQVTFSRSETYLKSIGGGKAKGGATGKKPGMENPSAAAKVEEQEENRCVSGQKDAGAPAADDSNTEVQKILVYDIGV